MNQIINLNTLNLQRSMKFGCEDNFQSSNHPRTCQRWTAHFCSDAEPVARLNVNSKPTWTRNKSKEKTHRKLSGRNHARLALASDVWEQHFTENIICYKCVATFSLKWHFGAGNDHLKTWKNQTCPTGRTWRATSPSGGTCTTYSA